jgi:hypothetical protein
MKIVNENVPTVPHIIAHSKRLEAAHAEIAVMPKLPKLLLETSGTDSRFLCCWLALLV